MEIIGITGGIASGKNFIANNLAKHLDAKIFDADLEVHKILEFNKKTIDEVANYFPESLENSKINRKILGNIVFQDNKKLKILEDIIHKKVRENYKIFLDFAKNEGCKFIILNIPLLLEKKGYNFDKLIAITVSPSIQKKRFILRAKENGEEILEKLENKFKKISNKQFKNSQRIKNADFVINNNFSKDIAILKINKIAQELLKSPTKL